MSEAAVATKPKASEVAAIPVPERKVQPLSTNRIKSGDFVRTFYVATAHENTEPQDLLRPEYFAHVAAQFKPRDRIEVWADDGSWIADLVVMGASRNSADVRLLNTYQINSAHSPGDTPSELQSYFVKHRGVHSQWSVIRKADNHVVFEGGSSRAVADAWLTNHLKAFQN